MIVESFNRFRRQSRGTTTNAVNRAVNPSNTVASRTAPVPAAVEADEAVEAATATALAADSGGRGGGVVGLNTRMNLVGAPIET